MSTTASAAPTVTKTVDHLRRLYFVRFVFAAVWAGTVAGIGSSLDAASITFLILYPAFDVAAAVYDVRTSRNRVLFVNMTISTAAVIGLAFATANDIPAVMRVWGVWAIIAGVVQLFVAVKRRVLGGQWAMIASGSISVLAGASFLVGASGATSAKGLAAYAAFGGLLFLVSALRLQRADTTNTNGTSHLSGAR